MKETLARFRFWLLWWYFAVSTLALLGFGSAAYVVFERRLLRETDRLLLSHLDGAGSPGDGVELFYFDAEGNPGAGVLAPDWLISYALEVGKDGGVTATLRVDEDEERGEGEEEVEHFWRIVGSPVQPGVGDSAEGGEAASGKRSVVLAVTDLQTLTERTADLLISLALAGAAALLLVGVGGYVLSRRAMAPAETAYEGMERFSGDVAHEVRTPLQVIRTQVDVALQQPRGSEAYRQALETVGLEAQRLANVVDGLLTLARAEAGASGVAEDKVVLDDLIFDTLPSAQRLAAPANVTVDVDVEGDAWVKGDAVLLRQALLVLVDNALRYTPSGSRLTLRGRPEGGEVMVEVEDQGPGIPAEVRKRLARGEGGKEVGAGEGEGREVRLGRGLSIVRWITEAHGGRVAILDGPSGGAIVRITLPVPLSSS